MAGQTNLYMYDETRQWLHRNGHSMSQQLREDVAVLKRLSQLMTTQGDMTLTEFQLHLGQIKLAEKVVDK